MMHTPSVLALDIAKEIYRMNFPMCLARDFEIFDSE